MGDSPRILIAEDEEFIVMLLEDMLSEEGYSVTSVSSLGDALNILDTECFDAAVLDVNLRGEAVFPLAGRLSKLGVPFAFATGGDNESIPAQFRAYPVLSKPYSAVTFIDGVASLVASAKS
jgi:DNA-binding response OmpR family regulator